MIRLARDSVDVLDAAWSSDAARDRVLGGLHDCLQRVGRSRVRLWPAGQLSGLFAAPERSSALAMIAQLSDAAPLPEDGAPAELALLDHI
jgi:hypothetical protein